MLLCTGVIKLEWVADTAHYLVLIMPLMFIPPVAGLVDVWDLIRPIVIPLGATTALSTLIVIFCAGWVTQLIVRRPKKKSEVKEEAEV